MDRTTKILIVAALVGLAGVLWSYDVLAHDRSYRHNHHSEYYRHYHHNHRRKSDNDDWAWAVGGIILGTVIANSQNEKEQTASGLPPPQRHVQTCYDEVAYDSNSQPYVLRRCFVTVE